MELSLLGVTQPLTTRFLPEGGGGTAPNLTCSEISRGAGVPGGSGGEGIGRTCDGACEVNAGEECGGGEGNGTLDVAGEVT